MPSKQKVIHSLSEERANITSKTRETFKEKTGLCNEKEINGFIVELQSFHGVVEFKVQHRKERVPFFKNRVLVNGKKLPKNTHLPDVMEIGAKVRLKVKLLNKRDSNHHFKILEIERKHEDSCAIRGHSLFTRNKACTTSYATDNTLVDVQLSGAPWKTTVSKSPYIDGTTGTVVNILSDSTGILLTDPDDNGGCKVSFEISNLFINGEKCKEKSLRICIRLGQSVYCTATKASEKDGIEYKAFAVWIGQRPQISKIISCYVPKMKISNLTEVTEVCCGTVKVLAPPKAAILAIEPNNYAVMFLTHLRNIKPDIHGWIGDYLQVGDTLLVQISGHFNNLCFAVSKVLKVNKWCKEVSEMLGQAAEVSSGSTASSYISLKKSSQFACITNEDSIGSTENGRMQNKSCGTPENFKNNSKSPGNNQAKHLFEKRESQKINKNILCGRTGKIVSYSTKSRGLLSDFKLGHVEFHKAVVVFPTTLGHVDLQEYLPVGTTVYYNSVFLEKKQNYVCTKLWIGKKEKQADFQSKPLILQCRSTVLTEGDLYEAVVFELQMPHGLIVKVKTPDMEVPVYVPLHILQLYPDGPLIDRKRSACIKCGDALFVNVHYSYNTGKTLNWVASKAWIRTSCADFEDVFTVKTKTEPRPTMSGKLEVITSNSGVLSREIGTTVFFSNKNAFLFEINLSQMDLQKVFIEGETLHYILPEDSNETIWHEASKVWYGTFDNQETLNQRIQALIDYWKKRGLQRPSLRAMIKELTRQVAEQNLQVLSKKTEMNSMCSGDSNINCDSSEREKSVLNKEAKSDVDLKIHQAEQNLQIASKGTVLNNLCSDSSNLTNVYSDRDVSALIKDTNSGIELSFESKMNTKLHINATQGLTDEESTVTLMTGFRKQQSMMSTDTLVNRELSTLAFETKQMSALYSMKQEVLHGLLRFVADGSLSPTILREVQILLKPILQKYDDKETLKYLLKRIRIGCGKGPRQLGSVEDKKSSIVNLTEQEHCEASGINENKLKKKRCVGVNHGNHMDYSVQTRGTKCVDAVYSDFGAAQCLLNKKSNDVTKIFNDAFQSDAEHMKNKIAKEKKYANKEVQTISTGDILYFKIVPNM